MLKNIPRFNLSIEVASSTGAQRRSDPLRVRGTDEELFLFMGICIVFLSFQEQNQSLTPTQAPRDWCIYPAVLSSSHQAGVDEIDVTHAAISENHRLVPADSFL